MELEVWQQWAVAVCSGLVILASAIKAVLYIKTVVQSLTDSLERLTTFPDEASRRFDDLVESIQEVAKETKANGGSSLRDVINNIEYELRYTITRQRTILESQRLCIFETDREGECIYASDSYLEMVQAQFHDVEGRGWLNFIHPDDRPFVKDEWYSAVSDNRSFLANYRFITTTGRTLNVVGEARAVEGAAGKPIGYVGMVRIINEVKEEDI